MTALTALAFAAQLSLGSMPPGTYCSSWEVGALDHEYNGVAASSHCRCRSGAPASSGCFSCAPRQLSDGGTATVAVADGGTEVSGTCLHLAYGKAETGCSTGAGLAPALAALALWLLSRRRVS